jgi:hypothetical protein
MYPIHLNGHKCYITGGEFIACWELICNSDMNYASIMRWKKMLGKSRMDTPEKLAALGT